jgi:hypothetical protein
MATQGQDRIERRLAAILTGDMRRREFIAMLGNAAAFWPLAAGAQQPAMPIIGFLNAGSAAQWAHLVAAFREGLNETGYTEGRNVTIQYRWAEGQVDRLPGMAVDLVRRRVAVIATGAGDAAARAAKAATTTIPIVFTSGADPVKAGLVSNINRPNGNVTGVSSFISPLGPKQLDLVRELTRASRIGVLVNPSNPAVSDYLTEARRPDGRRPDRGRAAALKTCARPARRRRGRGRRRGRCGPARASPWLPSETVVSRLNFQPASLSRVLDRPSPLPSRPGPWSCAEGPVLDAVVSGEPLR